MQGSQIKAIDYRSGENQYKKKAIEEQIIKGGDNVDWQKIIDNEKPKSKKYGYKKNQVSNRRWAKELIISLDNDKNNLDKNIKMIDDLSDFLKNRYGCQAQYFIHQKQDNIHCHLMLTTRDKENKKIKSFSEKNNNFMNYCKNIWSEILKENQVEYWKHYKEQGQAKKNISYNHTQFLKKQKKKHLTKNEYNEHLKSVYDKKIYERKLKEEREKSKILFHKKMQEARLFNQDFNQILIKDLKDVALDKVAISEDLDLKIKNKDNDFEKILNTKNKQQEQQQQEERERQERERLEQNKQQEQERPGQQQHQTLSAAERYARKRRFNIKNKDKGRDFER